MKFRIGIFGILYFLGGWALHAQPKENSELLKEQVFQFLTQAPTQVSGAARLLKASAWEALAYLESSRDTTADMLNQAVPDYYNFQESTLIIKLIDPDNVNDYGVTINTPYRIQKDRSVVLFDPETGRINKEWRIIGLDEHYLALDMGDIKVFFTHIPEQE